MPHLRLLAAAVAALGLCTAPAALAGPSTVGDSSGSPTANLCSFGQTCTYINYHHGKPTDVVKHSGTLTDFSVNTGSVGGQIGLRILHPIGHGKFKAVSSSPTFTVLGTGEQTFLVHVPVKTGDVLALTNSSSGIYMVTAPAGTCVRYFDASLSDGSSGKPDRVAPQLHLLLSAHVS